MAHKAAAALDHLYERTKVANPDDWAHLVDAQRKVVQAWISFAQGEKMQAVSRLRQAADIEDAIDKNPVTPGAVLPARELLADMLLMNGDAAGALAQYNAVLAINPNRQNSVSGVKTATLKLSSAAKE